MIAIVERDSTRIICILAKRAEHHPYQVISSNFRDSLVFLYKMRQAGGPEVSHTVTLTYFKLTKKTIVYHYKLTYTN